MARLHSQRLNADTERTIITDPRFMHLRIRDIETDKPPLNVVFSDMAGEVFSASHLTPSEIQGLTFLARADHVAILVDGAKLVEPKERHNEATNCRTLLRSIIDNGMVPNKPYVQVLFSRWDLVVNNENIADVHAIVDNLKRDLEQQFCNHVRKITFVEIAARPATTALPNMHNVEAVFREWIESSTFSEIDSDTLGNEGVAFSEWVRESEGIK